MPAVEFPEFETCTDFEKARERLLFLSMRDIPRSYHAYDQIRIIIRRLIEYVFQDASRWFTYDRVLRVKLVVGAIDRRSTYQKRGISMMIAIMAYEYITGLDLLDFPGIEEIVNRQEIPFPVMCEAVGTVALAWQIISNPGTIILTKEMLKLLQGELHPDL